MLNSRLLCKLYSYNTHIGHSENLNNELNFYILGKRFNFVIIDINKMVFLLKKALTFLLHLALQSGSILFTYSNFSKLNVLYKCFLLSIVKNSKQQLITYSWLYGSISNYYFSFFSFINSITKVWLNKKTYMINAVKETNIFNTFEYDDKKFYTFKYLFAHAKKNKNNKVTKMFSWYRKWHQTWIKKQKTYLIWQYKKKSLKQTNFISNLFLNDLNTLWKRHTLLNFKYIFLKVFYFVSLKKKDPFFLNMDSDLLFQYDFIHKKIMSYWRLILYFKHFNNYFQLPDVLFYIFPNGNDLPIKEYTNNHLVSMGIVDTNINVETINYPIISNDDSILLVIFYFTLCSNIFLESRYSLYSYLMNNNK